MKAGVARVIGRDSRAFTQSTPPGEREQRRARIFRGKDTASSLKKGQRAWMEEVVVVLRMKKMLVRRDKGLIRGLRKKLQRRRNYNVPRPSVSFSLAAISQRTSQPSELRDRVPGTQKKRCPRGRLTDFLP